MTAFFPHSRAVLVLAGIAIALPAAGPRLPAIVFVSRQPIASEPLAVPGLGPHHRAVAPGGRLLIREPDGRLRELVPRDRLYDMADPAVSPDGRQVAFSGTPHPDSSWRIYVVGLEGAGLRPLTRSDRSLPAPAAPGFARYDDFDPCWIGANELCFASTRYPAIAQYADIPVTNLYVIALDPQGSGGAPVRITMERNGAEEPAYDPATDRIVFARWWFSRFRPSETGLTTDLRATIARDTVNLWQAVSIPAHGGVPRLAFGDPSIRRGAMAYQPCILPGGALAAVYALNLGLSPRPGALGIQRFARGLGRARRVAGAVVPDSAGSLYDDAVGLAAPSACAPAALPGGRLLFSYSPGGRGDYGLYMMEARGNRPPIVVVDLPGTLELDAAPVVSRRFPSRLSRAPLPVLPGQPFSSGDDLSVAGTFTYHSLDVFASERRDRGTRGSPVRVSGAKIRFFAAPLWSAHGGPDTAVLIREAAIRADGSVEERGLPADVPLFEQIVDAKGRVILGPRGPAHVAGFNAGLPGRVSRCVGCHIGHSAVEPKR